MAIQVYLEKRMLKTKKRSGRREYRWALRWWDLGAGKFRCESTGTADKTTAEVMRKAKFDELNHPKPATVTEPEPPPADPPKLPTWSECSEVLRRTLKAHNARPSYVSDCILELDLLRRMFPEVESPGLITAELAEEWKRRRMEATPAPSPWTVKGDLSTLRTVFGKWLTRKCKLLSANPFAEVEPPLCDIPDVRIVSADEIAALFKWFNARWNNWRLPVVYLQTAAISGWRAIEIASLRTEDLLADGFVRVASAMSKTRRMKYAKLPKELHDELKACSAKDWAFGKFSDDLRRLLILWKKRPHHAARVGDFGPARLLGWLQDELQRFHDDRQSEENRAAAEAERKPETLPTFTLHDFRRTAITALQMSGASEKEAGIQVGCTPEVMRKHYEKLDAMAIAGRNLDRRLGNMQQVLRAGYARPEIDTESSNGNNSQSMTA